MTPERIEEIRKREEKATPGPWCADTGSPEDCVVFAGDGKFLGNVGSDHMVPVHPEGASIMFDVDINNCDFIAQARQDIPDLLAALAQREAVIADLKGALMQTRSKLTTYMDVSPERVLVNSVQARWIIDAALAWTSLGEELLKHSESLRRNRSREGQAKGF